MAESCFFDASQRMKPKPWDGRKIYPGAIEIKYDGRRLAIVKGYTRKWAFERMQTSEILDQLFWFEPIRQALELMPKNSAIDGELIVEGGRATDVVTAIQTESKSLRYCPFSIPWWGGRRNPCLGFDVQDEWLTGVGLDAPDRISIATPLDEGHRVTLLALCDELNIEGLVFKTTPNLAWWKLKRVETVDAFVVGWTPGLGKHAGKIGALEVAVFRDDIPTVVASVGKGGDDQWRESDPDALMNRVMEITHEGVQSGGRLKFSSFLRWRDDKLFLECGWDQIERARLG